MGLCQLYYNLKKNPLHFIHIHSLYFLTLLVSNDDAENQYFVFCCFSPHSNSYDDGSPVLVRKPAPLSRSNHSLRQQMNDSEPLSSSIHDQLSPINMSNETSLITSKNLISLFNAAEFDDD